MNRRLTREGRDMALTAEPQLRSLGWTWEEVWGLPERPYERPGLAYALGHDRQLATVTADYAVIVCSSPVREPSLLRYWRRGRMPWVTAPLRKEPAHV